MLFLGTIVTWGSVHVEFDGDTYDAALGDDASAALRPWIGSLLAADHLNVLVGSGLSVSVALGCGVTDALDMSPAVLSGPYADAISKHATAEAARLGRGQWNIEDQVRSALQLIGGLRVLDQDADALSDQVGNALTAMAKRILSMEREIQEAHDSDQKRTDDLLRFILALTHRPPSRDRAHLFTTNYDRVIEFGCDLAGIRTLDRFVGSLSPRFRSSRLSVDYHYNPPGIRGEPRYLEGVTRVTKLHGSIDWRYRGRSLRRDPLAFGAEEDQVSVADAEAFGSLMIYPNPAKDVETLDYPYAELFRDFSAAVCRPNTTLVTYGYGFGDDHINRVIADMCVVPATHLLVLSFDDAQGRVPGWLSNNVAPAQRTVVGGSDVATLAKLVTDWLPAPSLRAVRARLPAATSPTPTPAAP